MKKTSALFFLVALIFSSCQKKTVDELNSVNLVVWESSAGPDQFIHMAGAAYTKLHPNVTIKYVHVQSENSLEQIALDGPSGAGPDVFAAPHTSLADLVNGGHIVKAEFSEKNGNEILAACLQSVTYNGKIYGYPVSAETCVLFYNKDLISEDSVPKTWEDLAEFTKRFNAANSGKLGFVMDIGRAYYTALFTTANNNLPFGVSGTESLSTNINTPDAISGMEFFQQVLRPAVNIPAAELTEGFAESSFSEGSAAMLIGEIWNLKAFQNAGVNFGVATLPSLPGQNSPCPSFARTQAMFVSAYSEHKAEAAAFAEFLLTPPMQRLRFFTTGQTPAVRIKIQDSYVEGFIKQLDYAFPISSLHQMEAYWEVVGIAAKNIWDGADIASELETANAAILDL